MEARTNEAYGAVARLWSALYDAPPPCGQDAEALFEALVGVMEPLAFDQFYEPYVRPVPPQVEALERPLPSPARIRALDLALRGMLQTCPVPDRLRDLVEQLDDTALESPDLHLDGAEPPAGEQG